MTDHVESDCRHRVADDNNGFAAASDLVHGKSGNQVVSGRDGDFALPRAVCRRVVGVSARAGSGGARTLGPRRLPGLARLWRPDPADTPPPPPACAPTRAP